MADLDDATRRVNAIVAVNHLLSDILGRKGLGNAFEEIDEDTQEEIRGQWQEIIYKYTGQSI